MDYYLIIIMSQILFRANIIHMINESCRGPLIIEVNLSIEESWAAPTRNAEIKNPLRDQLADNVFQALEQGSADGERDSDVLRNILNLLAGGLSISQSHPVNPFENQEAYGDIDNVLPASVGRTATKPAPVSVFPHRAGTNHLSVAQ